MMPAAVHGSHLAVNVKVTADWFSPEAAAEFPGLTREWIERHLSDEEQYGWWEDACGVGWERAEELAREVWGPAAKVYGEGRSGGWLVVAPYGRREITDEDAEEWGPAEHLRWATFAAECRTLADDTPYQWTWMIGANVYEGALGEGFANLAQACACAADAEAARSFWGAPYGEAVSL